MKNRDQIRARNALNAKAPFRGAEGGDAVTGFPALIINNGLLATIAFSINRKGYQEICEAIAAHLADPEIDCLPSDRGTMQKMLEYLAVNDSSRLRICTAEALAYLNYLRRFAKGQVKEEGAR